MRTNLSIPAALCAAFVLLQPHWPAGAAEIDAVRRGNALIELRLGGPIAEGDGDRLEQALAGAGYRTVADDLNTHGVCAGDEDVVLHLDSEGGSFAEGLRIARRVMTFCMGTVIDADADCLGACALVFMAGSVRHHRWQGFLRDRRLHVSARLAFGAPAGSIRPALRAVATLLRLSTGKAHQFEHRMEVPRDLIAEVLDRPEERLTLKTVDQAGRWGIALVGAREPAAIDGRMLAQGCRNLFSWREGQYAGRPRRGLRDLSSGMTRARRDLRVAGRKGARFHAWMGDPLSTRCDIVVLDGNGRPRQLLYRLLQGADSEVPADADIEELMRTAAPFPAWMLLPPGTPVRSLAATP